MDFIVHCDTCGDAVFESSSVPLVEDGLYMCDECFESCVSGEVAYDY